MDWNSLVSLPIKNLTSQFFIRTELREIFILINSSKPKRRNFPLLGFHFSQPTTEDTMYTPTLENIKREKLNGHRSVEDLKDLRIAYTTSKAGLIFYQ